MHIVPVPTLNCDTKWERAQKREKRKLFHCARSVSAKSGGFRPTFAFTSRGRTCIVLASLNQTGRSKWIYIYPFPAPTHTHSLSSSCSLSHVVKAQFYHGKALSLFPSLSLHPEAAAHGRTSQFFFMTSKGSNVLKPTTSIQVESGLTVHGWRVFPSRAGVKNVNVCLHVCAQTASKYCCMPNRSNSRHRGEGSQEKMGSLRR